MTNDLETGKLEFKQSSAWKGGGVEYTNALYPLQVLFFFALYNDRADTPLDLFYDSSIGSIKINLWWNIAA